MPTSEQVNVATEALHGQIVSEQQRMEIGGSYLSVTDEFVAALDYQGIAQAVLAAVEALTSQTDKEEQARKLALALVDERRRIVESLRKLANERLRDPTSDAIDGFCAAQILNLATSIEEWTFTNDQR